MTAPKLEIEATAVVAFVGESLNGAVPSARFTLSGPTSASASLQTWTSIGSSYSECAITNFRVELTRTQRTAALSIKVDSAGNVAPVASTPPSRLAFDDEKLRDLLVLIKARTRPA